MSLPRDKAAGFCEPAGAAVWALNQKVQTGTSTSGGPSRIVVVVLPIVIVFVGARVLAPSAPDRRAELATPTGPLPMAAGGVALVGSDVLPDTQAELDRLIALLTEDPDDTNAYMELGYAYFQRARETGDPSDYGRGDTAFEEALRRDPAGVRSLTGRAVIALARHDFAGALELADRALKRIAAGQDATAVLQLVRDIQGLFAANRVNTDLELALYDANHGDPVRALELATAAYDVQPNVKAADALAWALFKNGRLDEAQDRAAEAIRLGTPKGQFYYHAGAIEAARGDELAAAKHLSRAFEVEPFFSPLHEDAARELLAEIEGVDP
jgi:tetratricopeptide (TPR) repeat protein